MASSLHAHYSWTSPPLIANAPMAGFAGARLSTAVSSAGGLGFIGGANDMDALSTRLQSAAAELSNLKLPNSTSTLPIGVGFLAFLTTPGAAAAVVAQHRPAAILISCPHETEDLAIWSRAMRDASPESHIWVQISSVAAALEAANLCAPDVLVLQGADAGGHGGFPGAGIVSLIPEARDALDEAGFGEIHVLAAGGVSDGRGVAAAVALGAEGVLMGTAFLVSEEVDVPTREYQEAILEVKDGGVSTVRATVFDELGGKSMWPPGYDGRALVNASYRDHVNGVDLEEVQKRYAAALQSSDKGYGKERRRAIWAGSGVGLLKEVKPAGDIVRDARKGAKQILSTMASKL